MHFIIQENISEDDLKSFIEAIEKTGNTYETFFHIPFDTAYPDLEKHDSNIFMYCASSVTDQVWRDFTDKRSLFKGVYNHTNGININEIYDEAPNLMWSERLVNYASVKKCKKLKGDEVVFVRPEIDDKFFAGTTMTYTEISEMCKKFIDIDEVNAHKNLFIGKFNIPEYEYRIFVVNNHVITSSKYRHNGVLEIDNNVPENVLDFAQDYCYELDGIIPCYCVIDIGTKDDKIGVIEVNSINNSGFYAIDKEKLVSALTTYPVKV